MSPQTYFRLSLLYPVVIGLLGLVFEPLRLLFGAILFAGLPYLIQAIILFLLIGQAHTLKKLFHTSLLAPIILLLLFIPFALILSYTPNLEYRNLFTGLATFSFYILVIGYAYVALAWLGYFVLSRYRLINTTTFQQT